MPIVHLTSRKWEAWRIGEPVKDRGFGQFQWIMFTGRSVMTGVTRIVVTHLLEGCDSLPALWHSWDESGRGGRVVVLPRLLDELAYGDQARHLSTRSRFPSVVPSPAVHPTPPPAPSCKRGCPFGGSLLATATPPCSSSSSSPSPSRSSLPASARTFTLRGHRSLHLSLTMNSTRDTPITFSFSSLCDERYKRRPGTKSDRERERERERERTRVRMRKEDAREKEKERKRQRGMNDEEAWQRNRFEQRVRRPPPLRVRVERESEREWETLAGPVAWLFSRHCRGEPPAVAETHSSNNTAATRRSFRQRGIQITIHTCMRACTLPRRTNAGHAGRRTYRRAQIHKNRSELAGTRARARVRRVTVHGDAPFALESRI